MTSSPFIKNEKTKIAVNKSKFFSSFPTRVKLGPQPQSGSHPYACGILDRHRFDADPDPDLDRHQYENSDPDRT